MSRRILKSTFSLLNVDYVQLGEKWNYSHVISPYFRLYYIDSGSGTISDANHSILLEPGYLYLIPSFTLCHLSCKARLSQYFVQFFEDSANGLSLFHTHRAVQKIRASELDIMNFKRLLSINPNRGINRSDNPNIYEKNVFYREYQELNNQQNLSVFMETQGIIIHLVSKFLSPATYKPQELNPIPTTIMSAISYITLNLDKELTVAQLADRANLNPDYFSRLFRESTGSRPIDYVHEKKIERAQYLIVTTPLTLAQIAELTGFQNAFYFSKIFKKITGIAPGRYKKQLESSNG